MKILLDENVNAKLKNFLPDFKIFTVREMNWLGKSNGELISLAIKNSFKAIISNDTNIKYQQNLVNSNLYFIILKTKSNNLELISPLIPVLKETLNKISSDNPLDKYFEIS